eukprot:CAMPEP_0201477484 /NCGR_PEP_ID=MMETSP0151_2-20130828/2499_1 /ASSEMBLY_ACC=CAM_ASM_000257 /TAXON_ID=200890 /ORGANISM="Paramoeba atlantica, Strain 621/1 / CCAP 1560/9" /LENGTH=392 /DNA_ID=CAMNT_0047858221 /DNA_START=49 /DNA_END=1227 /DNA_ORIENTATION=+
MPKRSKGDLSKRQTLKKKFSVLRHVREHRRDVKRAIRKTKSIRDSRPQNFHAERAILSIPRKTSNVEDLLQGMLDVRAQEKKQGKSVVSNSKASVLKNDSQKGQEAAVRKKKIFEDQDFSLQLVKCLDMSQLLILVVDARAPLSGVSSTLLLAAEVHNNTPVLLLLSKQNLVPSSIAQAWVSYLEKVEKFAGVLLYDSTAVVAWIQRRFGLQKVFVTIAGFPNVGVRTLTQNLADMQGGRVSVHVSSEAAKGRVPHSKEVTLLTLPQNAEFLRQPLCGLDAIYRPWSYIERHLNDIELHAEEVLSHFLPETICTHYRMGLSNQETNSDPANIISKIAKRRHYKNTQDAAKAVMFDYTTGKLKWCCLPPNCGMKTDNLTVLDESLLHTQDYKI